MGERKNLYVHKLFMFDGESRNTVASRFSENCSCLSVIQPCRWVFYKSVSSYIVITVQYSANSIIIELAISFGYKILLNKSYLRE